MKRPGYLEQIQRQFSVHPVCALLGPRQSGKTTLARNFIRQAKLKQVMFFDLENPLDLARLENPMLALQDLRDTLIVIDEVQLRPNLFPVLRVLVDNKSAKNRFLILGSASRDLIHQSSETLAGRIGYLEITPFSILETGQSRSLWLRGGFPPSFLSETDEDSFLWRQSYISTFLERDIAKLGFNIPAAQMRRFWSMLAHYHGQIFNASEIGRSLGVTHHTTRRYLDILEGTFMIRSLQPWFANLSKRQVKSPKVYFRDSGVLNALVGIKNEHELNNHPRLGSFWEGFALEEILRIHKASAQEAYFWATQSGAELDLLLLVSGKKIGFEFKFTDAPRITPSIKIALSDLELSHLYVIFPGQSEFKMDQRVTAKGLDSFAI